MLRFAFLAFCVSLLSGCGGGNDRASELAEIRAQMQTLSRAVEPDDMEPLHAKVRESLSSGDDDRAFAYLAAIIANDPSNSDILKTLQTETTKTIVAIEQADTESLASAESRLAVFEEVIRAAMSSASSVDQVDQLLQAEEAASKLRARFVAVMQKQANVEISNELHQVDEIAASDVERMSDTEARKLIRRSDRLLERIVDSSVGAESEADFDEPIAKLQGLQSRLDRRLEELSLSALQRTADSQTNEVLSKLENLLRKAREDVRRKRQGKSGTEDLLWQDIGRDLVEAELVATGIHPMASPDLQARASKSITELRKESVAVRAEQQASYNDWAISKIKTAISKYRGAKGWTNDDEEKFMETVREELGPIEPQYLHPAVSTLFSEMYQKLISELSEQQKIAATEAVESAEKLSLESF